MTMRSRVLAIALAMIAGLSCTKTVKLQPPDYEEHGSGLQYRIHMSTGCTYFVASFTANDSTVVVKSLHHSDNPNRCLPAQATPFEIKRRDIASIEKVEPGIGTPIVIITLAALVTALVIFADGLPGGGD